MFCRIFKDKCPLSGAKTMVQFMNPDTFLLRWNRYALLCFYYIASGVYYGCSEFKYPGTVAKSWSTVVLEICPTPNPTQKLPNSDKKCKTDTKTHLLMQPCRLWTGLNCFVEPLFHRIQIEAPCLSSTSLYSMSYRTKLLSLKTHRYEAGYMRFTASSVHLFWKLQRYVLIVRVSLESAPRYIYGMRPGMCYCI